MQASQLLWLRVPVNVQLANLMRRAISISIHEEIPRQGWVHLFWGGDHSLEFTQEYLIAHHRVEFLDALSDFLRRELLDALDQNLCGVGSAIPKRPKDKEDTDRLASLFEDQERSSILRASVALNNEKGSIFCLESAAKTGKGNRDT